ncbi:hypothetical protein ACSFBI_33410 [Variovorax sp. RB3P1]|uniref:hypothetical protein n=1 Tax=Variovorax sp. RB3P1 TaxID=3443732 RepID=UPI003F45587B
MSYDLRAWERPVGQADPASFEEASQILLELERLKPGPNPRFIELAEKMAERYPVQGQGASSHRDNGSDAAWVGDPVVDARGCMRAVWAFALPTGDRVRVLRFVVESANSLGLTVFDDQLGMAFIPPGRVLPTEHAHTWEGAKREMNAEPEQWTLASMRKEMKPHLAALLEPHGFVLEKLPAKSQLDAKYARSTEAGTQLITMSSRFVLSAPECAIGIDIRNDAITEILTAIFPERASDLFVIGRVSFNAAIFEGIFNGGVSIESEHDVHRILKMVEQQALPILDMTRTSAGINQVLNDTALFPLTAKHPREPKSLAEYCRNSGFSALISAWLNGNSQFSEVEQFVRHRSDNYASELKQEEYRKLDKVLTYLRDTSSAAHSQSAEAY